MEFTTQRQELEKRYRELSDWSQSHFFNPKTKNGDSVHQSQWYDSKYKIFRATVQCEDGSSIEFTPDDLDGRLKLAFGDRRSLP